jgi:hypothetical protein
MRGAVNREAVTCYLDALLFAMFSRLGSFEPILYSISDDEPTRRLGMLIRLWVNMLRTGMLIQTDIVCLLPPVFMYANQEQTEHLQDAIAACGWEDAAYLQQQDSSEAFSFLAEKLHLPLLTLKMDLFHNGTEDDKDDHKIIHERLLDVAVPDESAKLEECLENYFNNRVEVVRKLGRSNTISSVRSARSPSSDKGASQHVEVTVSEVTWSTPSTPISPQTSRTPLTPSGRHRTDSFIRPRIITDIKEVETGEKATESEAATTPRSLRKGSVRKEVLMPAWQFFNLLRPLPFILRLAPSISSLGPNEPFVLINRIAWYTKTTTPSTDIEVAAHFSNKPPVLGICLKRYAMSSTGKATRKNTFIDIPVDIRLPHFVDDGSQVGEPLMENFKLSLQSVICHRGESVNAGHYISFVRDGIDSADGDSSSSRRMSSGSQPPHYSTDRWIKHDDLAAQRVTYVDIEQILKDEMPYLLFYQVLPIEEISVALEPDPPSYEKETGIDVRVSESSPQVEHQPDGVLNGGYFDTAPRRDESVAAPNVRFSSELERPPRHCLNYLEQRRGSTAPTETSLGSTSSSILAPEVKSNPVTPTEVTTAQRLSRAASRFKSGSRSRPTSASGEGRKSLSFSRINLRASVQDSKTEQSKEHVSSAPSLSATNGPTDPRDSAIDIGESSLKPAVEAPQRGKSMRGRKREKSREPAVENGHHHHHHLPHKDKRTKGVPDRECIIM